MTSIQLQAGVYEDVVVVKTNDITIQGVGSGTDGSILRPPADLPNRCFGGIAGICIRGNGQTGTPVSDVAVTGMRAEGFIAFGFLAFVRRGPDVRGRRRASTTASTGSRPSRAPAS